jgi:hypothetical protein
MAVTTETVHALTIIDHLAPDEHGNSARQLRLFKTSAAAIVHLLWEANRRRRLNHDGDDLPTDLTDLDAASELLREEAVEFSIEEYPVYEGTEPELMEV